MGSQMRRARFAVGVAAVASLALPAACVPPTTPPAAPDTTAPAPTVPPGTTDPDSRLVIGEPTEDGFLIATVAADGTATAAATLSIGGMEASQWIGEYCVTGSGRYVAAAFGPAEFANRPVLKDRGAFAAVVDLDTGEAATVPERVALKYHSPGCGPGDEMVFLRHLGDDQERTELLAVGTDGEVSVAVERDGQLTSPTRRGDTLWAAAGADLVRLGGTPETDVVEHTVSSGTLFDVHASATGVDFLVADGPTVTAHTKPSSGPARQVAAGVSGSLRWAPGVGGANQLVGEPTSAEVAHVAAEDPTAAVSRDGTMALLETNPIDDTAGPATEDTGPEPDPSQESALTGDEPLGEVFEAQVRVGSTETTAAVVDSGDAVNLGSQVVLASNVTTPKCAIPRNDYQLQAMQPSPQQVEWAVDLAVKGNLTVTRPANFRNNGLSSYTPQGQFPRVGLTGGGTVPAQVLLGILAQESNLRQASKGALPGIAGNPLVADYYGVVYDNNGRIINMNYNNADCGYGIGQVTDNMTASATGYTASQKKMVALDYAANIAASLRILEQKWNQAKSQGLTANSGDPSWVENWYFAIWGYNSGIYAPSGSNPYGVGWTNNPANADYPPDRLPFLRATYDDARTPNRWPYQERVLGWAERAQVDYQGNDAYASTTLNLLLPTDPLTGQVLRFQMCVPAVNDCDPTHLNGAQSYCTRVDRKCWWHGNSTWTLSGTSEVIIYAGGSEPSKASPHPPACVLGDSTRPNSPPTAGAVIVDDIPSTQWNLAGCPTVASSGSFSFSFGATGGGAPLSAIDLHQIGAGHGGHFYYAHTNDPARPSHTITGTWTPPSSVSGWTRVLAHQPSHGADTYEATYRVWNGTKWYERTVNQRWNDDTLVDLGIFQLGAGSKVELTNESGRDHTRVVDIAWDAMVFVPAAKPTVSWVAFGDSYSAGEGVEPYWRNGDIKETSANRKNACHRSPDAYSEVAYAELLDDLGGHGTYHSAACSGAEIPDVLGPDFQFNEPPQLEQGWLDENTTHVSITIGGNDARFADILKGCILTMTSCTHESYHLTIGDDVDPEPLIDWEPQVIDALEPDLLDVVETIQDLAPNAEIILVGYPHVVFNGPRTGAVCGAFSNDNIDWFDEMGERLNGVIADVATATGATFVDMVPVFEGHEACASSNEWINALVAWSETGSGYNAPGSGSFHPKGSGHAQMATAILGAL